MGPLRVACVVLGCFILASVGWSEDAAPPAEQPKDVALPDPDKSFHDERLAEMREVAEAFPRDGDPPASPAPLPTHVEAHSAPAPPDVVAASHGDPVAAPNTPPHAAAQPDASVPLTDASATEHHEPQKAAAAAAPVPAPDAAAAVAATPPVAEQHAETTPQELAALPTPAGAPPPVADAAAKPIDQQQHSEAAPRAAEAAPPPPEPAPAAAAAAPAAAVIEPLAVAAASVSPSSPPPSNSGTPSSPPKTIRPNARRAPRVVSRYGDALSGYEYAGSGAHAADREKLAKLGEEGGGGDTQQQQRKAEDPDRGSFMDDDYYGA